MDAALQGMVLLQNEKGTLPLKQGAKLAVLGPNSNGNANWQLGNYHVSPSHTVTFLSPLLHDHWHLQCR
jgi:beta-glucosidase-like glycosyl hydrolase